MERSSRRVTIAIVSIVFLSLLGACGRKQPIQFSHKKHVDQGVECVDCHRFFKTRAVSGRPSVEVCAGCHDPESPMTGSSEEKKLIAEYISKGKEIPWKRVCFIPGHAYYTHFRHVVFGKIKCAHCHGDVASQDKPLTKPLRRITMYFCYNCHEERKISTDCITCHR